ncbi:MAG: amidase [Pseudomonadota bacterium]
MELTDLDLTGQRALLADGAATSAELIQAHVERIAAVEPTINGFAQVRLDEALQRAKANPPSPGPLAGLPYGLKDCLEVEGWITTFGTKGYANHVSTFSATLARRLEKAGGILLGLTNAPEIGTSIETDNLLYGRTNNPIDPTRAPGGSTGGGAALVKAKGLPFVVGSDFGGGSRNTAHCCGLFAHRPSLGRVSMAGYLFGCSGMKGQMCRFGPLARSVRDLELIFGIVSGTDPDDPKTDGVTARHQAPKPDGFRIAIATGATIAPPEPEIEAVVTAFGKALEPMHRVETPDLGGIIAEGQEIAYQLFSADAGRLLREVLAHVAGTRNISPSMNFWLESVGRLQEKPAGDFELLMSRWEGYRLSINRLFEAYDFLIWPSSPTVAPKHGETLNDQAFWNGLAYTTPLSLTASPVLVVPVGIGRDGLPVTVQIVAASWADEKLLTFGRALQEGDSDARDLIERALAIPTVV